MIRHYLSEHDDLSPACRRWPLVGGIVLTPNVDEVTCGECAEILAVNAAARRLEARRARRRCVLRWFTPLPLASVTHR